MRKTNIELEIGDWIRQEDGLFRGKIVGIGTIGKHIPVYKIDVGGGRIELLPKEQAQLWVKKEEVELKKNSQNKNKKEV